MLLSEAQQAFDLAMVGETASSTRRWYWHRLDSLVEFLGDVSVAEVTANDLRRWRAQLFERTSRWGDHPHRPEEEGGLSAWTLHGYVRAARRFFGWLVDEELLERNPARRLRLPGLPDEPPKAIQRDDLDKILMAARANGARDYAVVCFLADTGARVGGVAGLCLDDLDLGRGRATVREKGRGGKLRSRTVYLGPQSVEALRDWLRARDGDENEDHVFLSQRGPLKEGGIYQLLKRLAKRAGVEGRFNPHSFRHGWARGALERGSDLSTVSQILGHRDIAVTARFYARWEDSELAERHGRFSWLDSDSDSAEAR